MSTVMSTVIGTVMGDEYSDEYSDEHGDECSFEGIPQLVAAGVVLFGVHLWEPSIASLQHSIASL
jgi:hypothetical protein